jgi:hypothetical protein
MSRLNSLLICVLVSCRVPLATPIERCADLIIIPPLRKPVHRNASQRQVPYGAPAQIIPSRPCIWE